MQQNLQKNANLKLFLDLLKGTPKTKLLRCFAEKLLAFEVGKVQICQAKQKKIKHFTIARKRKAEHNQTDHFGGSSSSGNVESSVTIDKRKKKQRLESNFTNTITREMDKVANAIASL